MEVGVRAPHIFRRSFKLLIRARMQISILFPMLQAGLKFKIFFFTNKIKKTLKNGCVTWLLYNHRCSTWGKRQVSCKPHWYWGGGVDVWLPHWRTLSILEYVYQCGGDPVCGGGVGGLGGGGFLCYCPSCVLWFCLCHIFTGVVKICPNSVELDIFSSQWLLPRLLFAVFVILRRNMGYFGIFGIEES